MSAKSVSTESHRCLSLLNFNSFYNELLNEVHPVFIDQNTWQINTQPGNGCAGFQYPFCKYLKFSIQPVQQKSHKSYAKGLSLLASGLAVGQYKAYFRGRYAKKKKIKVTRKVSCEQNGQIKKQFEFTKLWFTNWRHTTGKSKQKKCSFVASEISCL